MSCSVPRCSDKRLPNCSTTAACILGAIFNSSFVLCPTREFELINGMVVFLSKSDQSRPPNRLYVPEERVYGSQRVNAEI